MTTIIVTHADNRMDQFHFGSDAREIAIGRRSVNEVCVPDLSVSGRHARILFGVDGVFIEDLKSTNGTYINGRLISRQLLDDQDEIVLGKVRLTFLVDSVTSPQTGPNTSPHMGLNAGPERSDARPTGDLIADSANLDAPIIEHARRESTPENPDSDNDDSDLVLDRSSTSGTYEPFTGAADESLSLSDRARVALGREREHSVDEALAHEDLALAERALRRPRSAAASSGVQHPLDGLQARTASEFSEPDMAQVATPVHQGAVIEIRNGAKSGQVLPIDKPVTTLGRPGVQIAAIMRKPDGFFLMHIESDDNVSRPTLNENAIGDEPVLLAHGDQMNVAGIDVQFLRP